MTQKYTLKIVLDDSGDEFSESFNPMDPEQVATFEQSIKEILEDNHWNPLTVQLLNVSVDL
jgi:hypothetical protein